MIIITASVYKDTKKVQTGISVNRSRNGQPQIKQVAPGSLFAKHAPQLQPGMRIISINYIQCYEKSPSEVTRLIKNTEGQIDIVCYYFTAPRRNAKSQSERKKFKAVKICESLFEGMMRGFF